MVKTVYAVLHSRSEAHYVVCSVRVEQKKIIIFDGMKTTLVSWFTGILKVLCYCALTTDADSVVIKQQAPNKLTIEDNDKIWSIYGPIAHIKQNDGHSCGPIACHKLMQVFGRTPEDHDVLTWVEPRKLVTNDFRALMTEVEDDICIPVPEAANVVEMNAKNAAKTNDDVHENENKNPDDANLKTEKKSNLS